MKKIKLMTHVVIGYPSLQDTIALVKTMVAAGADIVELQIPFSDPLADGPTIMKACEKALENGIRVSDAFKIMKELVSYFSCHAELDSASSKSTQEIPGSHKGTNFLQSVAARNDNESERPVFLFMCYYNTVFKFGIERFISSAKQAGASGLIVPDMPIDEEGEEHFYRLCKKYDLAAIHVVSPASTNERLHLNAKMSRGFVYATALQGITGVRGTLSKELNGFLQRVRNYFTIPVAVGFGISKKEHFQSLNGKADIAVVGSAIIDLINKSPKEKMLKNVEDFIFYLSSRT